MWRVQTKNRLDMVISEYHNVVYKPVNSNGIIIKPFHEIRERMQKNKEGFAGNIPKTFCYDGKGIELEDNVIAYSAGKEIREMNILTNYVLGIYSSHDNQIESIVQKYHERYNKHPNLELIKA